jgi:hypothetical protein
LFTLTFFVALFSILWEQTQTGHARLWCLPLLMIAWVNLHPGFVAGVGLLLAYLLLELEDVLLWPTRRTAALCRVKSAWPWIVATCAATLLNPWGWNLYAAMWKQRRALAAHAQWISEWASQPLNWDALSHDSSIFTVLLAIAAAAVIGCLWQRRVVVAVLLLLAANAAIRYVRMQALFACTLVILGPAALGPITSLLKRKITDSRMRAIMAGGVAAALLLYAAFSSVALVNDSYYMKDSNRSNFGAGLSWWFPEGAAAFIEKNQLPGNIFNVYNEGGHFVWRLGPKYLDYIDGRAIPFGDQSFLRLDDLMQSDPDSSEWEKEADRYAINTLLIPIARYDGLTLFPHLRQFCTSRSWRPVYLDEVSAVFLRNTPATQELIEKFGVDCARVPLPGNVSSNRVQAFNQVANAAGILYVLGRRQDAIAASTEALNIFPESVISLLRARQKSCRYRNDATGRSRLPRGGTARAERCRAVRAGPVVRERRAAGARLKDSGACRTCVTPAISLPCVGRRGVPSISSPARRHPLF